MQFSVINLGCKVNLAELEKICSDLTALDYRQVHSLEESDFAVINTCTVTQNADKKSLREVRILGTKENVQHVFVTGCYTELEKNFIEKAGKKCTVVSQKNKTQLATIVDNFFRNKLGFPSHLPSYSSKWQAFKTSRAYAPSLLSEQDVFFGHTRAFVKIQDGCNAFCSYCRIPFARGAPVSRSLADVVAQVKKIAAANIPEIVITGINLSTYRDVKTKANFSQLVAEVLNAAGSCYVRISSLEPHFLDERFLNLISHPALVPHFHLPLQASSNSVLRLMGRLYSIEEYKNLLDAIRQRSPRFSISTDIITGHPEETEEDFANGIKFIEDCRFSSLHVFPFSLRPLTEDYEKYSNVMPVEDGGKLKFNKKKLFAATSESGLSGEASEKQELVSAFEKKYRAQMLRKLSKKLSQNYSTMLSGSEQRVVLERKLEEDEMPTLFASNDISSWFCSKELRLASNNGQTGNVNWQEVLQLIKNNEVEVFYGTSEYYRKGYVFYPNKSGQKVGQNITALFYATPCVVGVRSCF